MRTVTLTCACLHAAQAIRHLCRMRIGPMGGFCDCISEAEMIPGDKATTCSCGYIGWSWTFHGSWSTAQLCKHLVKTLSPSLPRTPLPKMIGSANGPGARLRYGKVILVTMWQPTTLLSPASLYVESATVGTRTSPPPPLFELSIQKVHISCLFLSNQTNILSALPNPQSIRQSISAAQSRGTFISISPEFM